MLFRSLQSVLHHSYSLSFITATVCPHHSYSLSFITPTLCPSSQLQSVLYHTYSLSLITAIVCYFMTGTLCPSSQLQSVLITATTCGFSTFYGLISSDGEDKFLAQMDYILVDVPSSQTVFTLLLPPGGWSHITPHPLQPGPGISPNTQSGQTRDPSFQRTTDMMTEKNNKGKD